MLGRAERLERLQVGVEMEPRLAKKCRPKYRGKRWCQAKCCAKLQLAIDEQPEDLMVSCPAKSLSVLQLVADLRLYRHGLEQVAFPRHIPGSVVLLQIASFCDVCAGLSSFSASAVAVRGHEIERF